MKKIKEKEYAVGRATAALAFGALGSRGVGFLREIVVAAKFGTGRAFDLYVAASAFPIFLSSIFLYALPDYLVPYFSRLKENRPAALKRFLFITLLAGSAFLVLLYFAAPLLVRLLAPGLPAVEIPFGARAFQILLLFVFGTAMEAVLRSYYQVEGRFGLTAFSPLLFGLAVLASVFFLSGKLSVYALAWGWCVGSLLPMGVMLAALFFSPAKISPREPLTVLSPEAPPSMEWKNFSYVLAVTVLGQLMVFLDRFFGSFLPPEALSAFYYASLPVLFPVGLLVYPLGYAIFPKLSLRLAEKNETAAAELLTKALGWINFILIPATVLFVLAPQDIIRLIFERGVFDADSTRLSSGCLRLFALSLLASGHLFVLSRVYLAAGRGKRLVGISAGALLIKALAAYLSVRQWGLQGLAGAGSFSLMLFAFLQFQRLPMPAGLFSKKTLGYSALMLAGISLLAYGAAWFATAFLSEAVGGLWSLLRIFLFGILYLAGCFILKVPATAEMTAFVQKVRLKGLGLYGTFTARFL